MSLSFDARSILDAARDGDDPTEQDKVRVRRAIAATIGTATAVGATSGAAAATSAATTTAAATATATATTAAAGTAIGTSLLTKILGVTVAVGLAGGTIALEPWNAGTPTASDFAHAPVLETDQLGDGELVDQATPRPLVDQATPRPLVDRESEPATAPARARPRARERARVATVPPAPQAVEAPALDLAAELALVRRAEAARRGGRPADALAQLDEHARRFPDGSLTAERQAGRVLALCDLGRAGEARALADRFLAAYPRSPLAARVQSACR